jgi:hypothetical protein
MDKERFMNGGVLPETKQAELDKTKKVYEKIFSSISTLSEYLEKDVPSLEVWLCAFEGNDLLDGRGAGFRSIWGYFRIRHYGCCCPCYAGEWTFR